VRLENAVYTYSIDYQRFHEIQKSEIKIEQVCIIMSNFATDNRALINGKGGALFAFCILKSLYNLSEDSKIKLQELYHFYDKNVSFSVAFSLLSDCFCTS
jgi:hypothetical protein